MDATHLILEVVLTLKMLLIITASSAFLEPWIATGVGTECGQAIVVCSAVVSQGGKIRGFQDLAICCPCHVSSSINTGLTLKPKLCDHPYLLVPFFFVLQHGAGTEGRCVEAEAYMRAKPMLLEKPQLEICHQRTQSRSLC